MMGSLIVLFLAVAFLASVLIVTRKIHNPLYSCPLLICVALGYFLVAKPWVCDATLAWGWRSAPSAYHRMSGAGIDGAGCPIPRELILPRDGFEKN